MFGEGDHIVGISYVLFIGDVKDVDFLLDGGR